MQIIKWLHLWLGLFSGGIVFIVCLTGGIWVLRDEVAFFTEPFHWLNNTDVSYKNPTTLHESATRYLDSIESPNNYKLHSLTYRETGKSSYIDYSDTLNAIYVGYLHMDPHTGKILYNYVFQESATHRFFEFIRSGHRFLWLPRQIGSPIVGAGCLVFLIVMVTGIFWWYPRKWTKSTRAKSFRIMWSASWKRVNIDLHNVLGFYAFIFAFVLTYTGIYYSFQWYREMHHSFVGESRTPIWNELSVNEFSVAKKRMEPPVDMIWETILNDVQIGKSEITLSFLYDSTTPIQFTINPYPGTYYGIYSRYFDPGTLTELSSKGFSVRNGTLPFEKLTAGQKIIRLNSDLHVGTIGGLSTKIIACITCLICASLPVTGFIIWYNRKWGKKKRCKK
ncbi:PepSY domain-containing protein [Sphingobacterium sp. JB170]|uniref:PepSY-associated TM helix domain-containing protein n=1 Tax=Sphingobacterium sp. JB170 TaxID=1434842 RepID=UPI00097EF471|nr:PepSY-associated TM helix domain-containing protein [Sphingobacterium sp. JB170]SJN22988.1 putative iron-regulated membrane protein [Sphingobacterium sp. JB170]